MTTTRIHAHLWKRPGETGAALTINSMRDRTARNQPQSQWLRVTQRLSNPPARDEGQIPGDPRGEHTSRESPMRLDFRFSVELTRPDWLVTALLAIREALCRRLDDDDSTPPDDEDEE
ncbi:hypothetical protein FAZ79_00385 [Guyparkeria sp. SB14A]|uniref:hypothetical protein n=1 Tax=Guyparkeria sp. SB14A TaxID=2571147 RepID=UPI0010AD7E6E|nr:hypothetical protein [Guyparkeria sp. SB14A]TKA91797.1 hypothetical protein FAZ79_00385 [Guyparkeria sp. SB14A]